MYGNQVQNGGVPHPFPAEYLKVITPAMEAKLNEKRQQKAKAAAKKAGMSEADAERASASYTPVQLGQDRKTIIMSNGAEAGYAIADRDGNALDRPTWTTVHGAPKEQFDRIRQISQKGDKKGQKPLSMSSAKAAFTRYWKNREFKNPKSRQAAMQYDLNYAPANDNNITTKSKYLRNPGKFDYAFFDDSRGPRSKFYDATRDPTSDKYVPGSPALELHRRKANPAQRSKSQLAAQWPVAEFQEADKKGVMRTVRHRVDAEGNPLKRAVSHKRSHTMSKKQVRKAGETQSQYEARLAVANKKAKVKRDSVRAAKLAAQRGGRQEESSSESESEQEEEQRQGGGRAVSLKTAVRLLRSYYNNKYNKN